MKRYFIFGLLLLPLASSAQQDTSMRMIYQQQRVKGVEIYEHKYKKEKPKGKGTYRYYEAYDRSGNLTLKYDEFDKAYIEMYEYDKQGNVIQETRQSSGNTMLTYSYQRKYDSSGTVNTEATINPSNTVIKYTYDSAGNCTGERSYSSPVSKPESCYKQYYTHNRYGQLTRAAHYLENDSLYSVRTWEYDSSGHCTLQVSMIGGDTISTTQHVYDSKGNRTETIVRGGRHKDARYYIHTTYNSLGLIDHVIEYDYYLQRLVYYRYVYTFY